MNLYEKRYQDDKYYWGKEPSTLCKICLEYCDWQVSSPAGFLAGADEGVCRPRISNKERLPRRPPRRTSRNDKN